ncbi:MAG: glycosyltransferase family 4 protein [Chloroflexota bacterium]
MRVLFLPDYSEANAYQRELASGLRELGVRVSADPTRAGRILPVSEAMRRHGRPDIIHVHWTEPYIASGSGTSRFKAQRMSFELRLAHRAGIGIVWTAHDLFRHDRATDPVERSFMRSLFGIADAVIVHCASAADGLVEALGIVRSSRSKIQVIPHGHYVGVYPDTLSRTEARRRLEVPKEARLVAFVGWVRPYKGVTELLEAFAEVPEPSARLVVAGRALDDAYAQRIRDLAAADGRVALSLGFVADDELQLYLRAADVVATPFREIFTSGSVLLAMSFGRAVIAPRRGCVADALDEAGGILYDADDPQGLKTALRVAMDADLEAMGRYNGEHLERFDWSRVAAATQEVYEAVR